MQSPLLPPRNYYKTLIQIIKKTHQNLLFGSCFHNPPSQLVLYKQHMYSLFLLLYFHGEKEHKRIVIDKAIECRDYYERVLKQEEKELSPTNKKGKNIVKMLDFTIQQMKKQKIVPEQLHSIKERQYIRKSFKAVFEMDKKLTIKSEMNLVDFSKLAAYLINATCQVNDYYEFQVITFRQQQFYQNSVDVFIEINKQTETYKYIKQYNGIQMMTNSKYSSASRDSNLIYRKMVIRMENSITYSYTEEENQDELFNEDQSELDESIVAIQTLRSLPKYKVEIDMTRSVDKRKAPIIQPQVMGSFEDQYKPLVMKKTNSMKHLITENINPQFNSKISNSNSNNTNNTNSKNSKPNKPSMLQSLKIRNPKKRTGSVKVQQYQQSQNSDAQPVNFERMQAQVHQNMHQKVTKFIQEKKLSDIIQLLDNESEILAPAPGQKSTLRKYSVKLLQDAIEEMVSKNLDSSPTRQIEARKQVLKAVTQKDILNAFLEIVVKPNIKAILTNKYQQPKPEQKYISHTTIQEKSTKKIQSKQTIEQITRKIYSSKNITSLELNRSKEMRHTPKKYNYQISIPAGSPALPNVNQSFSARYSRKLYLQGSEKRSKYHYLA